MKVKNKNGYELDFEASVNYMDDEIREELHKEIVPCTNQEFFTAYEKTHEAKFKTEWELSKANPTW